MAGQYTQILEIIAEDEAEAGSTPVVGLRIRNLGVFTQTICAGGHVRTAAGEVVANLTFDPECLEIRADHSRVFYTSFTMPNRDVIIYGVSMLGYFADDSMEKAVAVKRVEPQFKNLSVSYRKGS